MKSVKAPSESSRTIGSTYCNEILHVRIVVEFESATDFESFETLHNNVLDINDQLLYSDVQTEVGQMYDELQQSFATFQ